LQKKKINMNNPIGTALKGKGLLTMLSRLGSITRRYGFVDKKIDSELTLLVDILREFNCQATLPVTATALARHQKIARRLQSQGIELAVHGYLHIDYSQLSLDEQIDHFQRSRQIFESAGIKPTGFRCPYLRSNSDTILALKECGFLYDSSPALVWDVAKEWDSDSFRHVLSFYGSQPETLFPSIPHLTKGLVRIPYCLPDDEALIERFKLTNKMDMEKIWLDMLDKIYANGELFTIGLHPERTSLCKDALRAVLKKARQLSPPVWIARLDEIAKWYIDLGKATFDVQTQVDGCIRIRIQGPSRAVIISRSVNIPAQKKLWSRGFYQIINNEFTISSAEKPWIGLPPNRPESLELFLRHQGFLVEISAETSQFSYYFDQTEFNRKDERPLLTLLDNGTKPLIRLGRWPEGAKAALAVTGDVDAFTIWDYGMRIINR
jgi:peptidoglycan/xylan/chitin deacetylase (PgdA/CDA1 family)